jgi:predicted ATPase/DNA-binding winged helix-turn-helix (wHTH) protein
VVGWKLEVYGQVPCISRDIERAQHGHLEEIMMTTTLYRKGAEFSFGDTTVVPSRRELIHSGEHVAVGDRAFDILLLLLDRRGAVVSKDQIMQIVWPQRVIGENTLESQMSDLRRALRNDRGAIRTISGRGYQFVGILGQRSQVTSSPLNIDDSFTSHQRGAVIPAIVSPLIGRNVELAEVIAVMQSRRLVTLVGPGGIGKTRLAIEVVRGISGSFGDGVYLADFAAISTADDMASVVNAALGFSGTTAPKTFDQIASALRRKRLLLLLDNCEHLVERVAHLTDALLRAAPGLSVLATSREPIRIAGEFVYRVPSLGFPVEDDGADSCNFGAVQLFKERLNRKLFAETDRISSATMVRICQRLDGIPLAIELAASCTTVFGIVEVAERLDDLFRLLRHGARTAAPRHKSLRASIDWSYDPLPRKWQIVLSRLAMFPGPFSLESARNMACCTEISSQDVTVALIELVNKSLISVIPSTPKAPYRLLETIRAYALERLQESDTYREWSIRNFRHFFQNSLTA